MTAFDHDQDLSGVAIVGMAGRFPGASDVEAFWRNAKDGVDAITRFGEERLALPIDQQANDEQSGAYVCAKGMLDGVEDWDARFFGYLPREAQVMDPQHRIFLEICSDALDHGGCDPERYPGAIGVFAGCYMDTYLLWNLCSNRDFLAQFVGSIQVGSLQTELGNDKDYLATRVAFKLGLRGPAMTLQTACSTSLVAIATACQSIESHQCDMALAGGVTIVLPQEKGYFYNEGGMLSPDGRCRTFDADAAGTVFSNGAAVLLLKRYEDAVADGDAIYAVIRGYAANNDGGAKVSYTAPSVDGQAEVVELAMGMAGFDPASMGYVEAHGTATPIGDPIEIAGLTKAYGGDAGPRASCAIGSVKASLGHLDCASGAIGLIKTALAVHEGVIPPLVNYRTPNPRIDFDKTPFVPTPELTDWPNPDAPRRAGVSSFGVGGTNAHVVLEDHKEPPRARSSAGPQLLPLSAMTKTALNAAFDRLADRLEADPTIDLPDAAHTLQTGRRVFQSRGFVVADDAASAAATLRTVGPRAALAERGAAEMRNPPVVFLFPGQGAQHPGMLTSLYAAEPVVRDAVDAVLDVLTVENAEIVDAVRDGLLWSADSGRAEAEIAEQLAQTQAAQPAIFAVETALALLLSKWGVAPACVIGHSVGEFAAAVSAGVFALEDAARLVVERGKLMQAAPPGAMLAVRAPRSAVEPLLPSSVQVAAVNAMDLTVVGGPFDAVDAVAQALSYAGVEASRLKTSHAFHSPMMESARAPLVSRATATLVRAAEAEIVSTATGAPLGADALQNPAYWGEQLMRPVLFADAVAAAAEADPTRVFLEVGPGRTLAGLTRRALGDDSGRRIVSCLGPAQAPGDDRANALAAAGRLWISGVELDWSGFHAEPRRRVALPSYPFEKKRHWVDPTPFDAPASAPAAPGAPAAPAAAHQTPSAPAQSPAASPQTDLERLIHGQLQVVAAQLDALTKR